MGGVTAYGIESEDPVGDNHMCGPNATAATRPVAWVYDHLRFIVDDKLGQVIEVTAG